MDDAVLADIGRCVVGSVAFTEETTIVWHAGEPCVLSPDWYAAAADRLSKTGGTSIGRESFQTNGTLINDAWIDYFKRPGVGVGVSLDGHAEVHDRIRLTRSGGGTHSRVMAGIDRLNRAGVPFHIIAVVSAHSMEAPREVAKALIDSGAEWIGLNVEEVEGVNTHSTLYEGEGLARYRRFLEDFLDEIERAPRPPMVREQERFRASLAAARGKPLTRNQENTAGAIISIDAAGRVSTFSPELLGNRSEVYGDFVYGDVAEMRDLSDLFLNRNFLRTLRDVQAGVAACSKSCAFFGVCGGGSPSNKFGEHGTFNATRTQHCDYAIKALYETLLDRAAVH